MQNVFKSGLLAMLMLSSQALTAADDNAEIAQSEASILRQSGVINGYLTLPVGDTSIDATLIPDRSGDSFGKVLILHDSHADIDSPGVVNILREGLPDAGWTTMTVALSYPIEPQIYLSANAASTAEPAVAASAAVASLPEKTETTEESVEDDSITPAPDNTARIAAALAYLNAQQPGVTVVVALGEAAQLTDALVGQLGEQSGLVWVRPQLELKESPLITPILDIAPTIPGRSNREATARRVFMQQQQVSSYSQRLISGAGYRFYGFEPRVLSYVRAWLSKQYVTEEQS